jgi:hypothetical protein
VKNGQLNIIDRAKKDFSDLLQVFMVSREGIETSPTD